MKTICLTLHRWQEAHTELNRVGIKPEKFPAVYNEDPVKSFNQSQTAILSSITETTLVVEDDVQFIAVDFWTDIMNDMPKEFDLLYLGGNVIEPNKKRVSGFWWKCTDTWTTHAIIYSPEGAKRILELWDQELIYDEFLRRNQPQLKAFICKPFLAVQKPGYSSLQKQMVNYSHIFDEAQKRLI